jgi:hypothetical protein
MLLLHQKEAVQGLLRKLLGLRAFSLGLVFRKNVLSRTLCRTRARNVLASGSPEREPGIWHRRCPPCFTPPSYSPRWYFTSKKGVRYIEHGVKVEFKKGLPFPPKPSAPKFVDPVHTPPDKDNQCIVHVLCNLNEATVKRQTTYEDLRMLKSVVKPQDFMPSLDVESAYFHVPIHPKHLKFFSSHLALPLFVNDKFIEMQ